jgi:hypothetical protein
MRTADSGRFIRPLVDAVNGLLDGRRDPENDSRPEKQQLRKPATKTQFIDCRTNPGPPQFEDRETSRGSAYSTEHRGLASPQLKDYRSERAVVGT